MARRHGDRVRMIDPGYPGNGQSFLTAGVDIGTRSAKIALFEHSAERSRVVATGLALVQGRRNTMDARLAVREAWMIALREAGASPGDVVHAASTGVNARGVVHVGHFYQRLSLVWGATHLFPRAVAVLDVGMTQVRCLRVGVTAPAGRRAPGRLDACSAGELLEQLARRSGLTLDELALLPAAAWIYDDLGVRATGLLRGMSIEGGTVLAGGLAMDARFSTALRHHLHLSGNRSSDLLASPEALFTGAYGAALLAARRYRRIGLAVELARAAPGRLN
jgi:activator of 2-hydroxyglutaryl-CoA dehydratase